MQMWEPRSAHVSRILAWGILDQDNTSCLVQGIPALEDLDVVPLGPILVVDSVMHIFASLLAGNASSLLWQSVCVFIEIEIVLDLLC